MIYEIESSNKESTNTGSAEFSIEDLEKMISAIESSSGAEFNKYIISVTHGNAKYLVENLLGGELKLDKNGEQEIGGYIVKVW